MSLLSCRASALESRPACLDVPMRSMHGTVPAIRGAWLGAGRDLAGGPESRSLVGRDGGLDRPPLGSAENGLEVRGGCQQEVRAIGGVPPLKWPPHGLLLGNPA